MQSKTLKYLSYGSTAGLIAMMMAASVIERLRGAETAQALIYHHPVFFVFWAVAAVSGLALLVRRIGWKRPATLAMHAAFVLPVMQKPRFFHLYCILAFVAVLITYFGVNLFLGGVHSYA